MTLYESIDPSIKLYYQQFSNLSIRQIETVLSHLISSREYYYGSDSFESQNDTLFGSIEYIVIFLGRKIYRMSEEIGARLDEELTSSECIGMKELIQEWTDLMETIYLNHCDSNENFQNLISSDEFMDSIILLEEYYLSVYEKIKDSIQLLIALKSTNKWINLIEKD